MRSALERKSFEKYPLYVDYLKRWSRINSCTRTQARLSKHCIRKNIMAMIRKRALI